MDEGLLKLQKERLFKELALQKEQLIEEQKILERLESTASNEDSVSKPALRKMSKEQIVNQYEKDRLKQELKTKEFLTLLNRFVFCVTTVLEMAWAYFLLP